MPREILQENPRQILQIYATKIPDTFLQRGPIPSVLRGFLTPSSSWSITRALPKEKGSQPDWGQHNSGTALERNLLFSVLWGLPALRKREVPGFAPERFWGVSWVLPNLHPGGILSCAEGASKQRTMKRKILLPETTGSLHWVDQTRLNTFWGLPSTPNPEVCWYSTWVWDREANPWVKVLEFVHWEQFSWDQVLLRSYMWD